MQQALAAIIFSSLPCLDRGHQPLACSPGVDVFFADGRRHQARKSIGGAGKRGHAQSGQQWMPWIHLDDLVALFNHLLQRDDAQGAFNACAPEVVRNSDFTRTLGKVLRRPTLLPAPAWALRLVLGDMSVLLLGGQHLQPQRTQASGFHWRYPRLESALAALLK